MTQRKVVEVAYGGSKRIGFVHVATMDELDRHQDYDLANNKSCKVNVRIVDSFGEVQG